jgi:hypothetical protein
MARSAAYRAPCIRWESSQRFYSGQQSGSNQQDIRQCSSEAAAMPHLAMVSMRVPRAGQAAPLGLRLPRSVPTGRSAYSCETSAMPSGLLQPPPGPAVNSVGYDRRGHGFDTLHCSSNQDSRDARWSQYELSRSRYGATNSDSDRCTQYCQGWLERSSRQWS